MLTDTLSLGTVAVTFTKRAPAGTISQYVPVGDPPASERKLRIGHEIAKSGTVNTLCAVSHVLTNAGSPTGATALASAQLKITRPPFASAAEMKLVVDQLVTLLTASFVGELLNQEQ